MMADRRDTFDGTELEFWLGDWELSWEGEAN
jgi:hypothetical protein